MLLFAPTTAILPAGHVIDPVQVDDVRPVVEPYLPAGQFVHTVESVTVEDKAPGKAYLPEGHVTTPEHAEDGSPVVEPYVPAGHTVQTAEPLTEYVPRGQAPVH